MLLHVPSCKRENPPAPRDSNNNLLRIARESPRGLRADKRTPPSIVAFAQPRPSPGMRRRAEMKRTNQLSSKDDAHNSALEHGVIAAGLALALLAILGQIGGALNTPF